MIHPEKGNHAELALMSDIPFAPIEPHSKNNPDPKCWTCMDHGFVGGLVPWGDGQVDSICEDCPDCGQTEKEEK